MTNTKSRKWIDGQIDELSKVGKINRHQHNHIITNGWWSVLLIWGKGLYPNGHLPDTQLIPYNIMIKKNDTSLKLYIFIFSTLKPAAACWMVSQTRNTHTALRPTLLKTSSSSLSLLHRQTPAVSDQLCVARGGHRMAENIGTSSQAACTAFLFTVVGWHVAWSEVLVAHLVCFRVHSTVNI